MASTSPLANNAAKFFTDTTHWASVFTNTQVVVEHARLKRPVVRHYSIPSALAMEPLMDKRIQDFLGHLETRYVKPSKPSEFGEWMNPYIVGRNKGIFGDDADEFRPERWLQRSGGFLRDGSIGIRVLFAG